MDNLQTVKDVRKKYPRSNPGGSPLGVDAWRCIVEIAQKIGAKVFRKDGGDNCTIPPGVLAAYPSGVSISRTIIGRGMLGTSWVKVLGDGEGAAPAIWSPGNTPADGEYIDVGSVVLDGDTGDSGGGDSGGGSSSGLSDAQKADVLALIAAELKKPRQVAFRAAGGQYVCAEGGGGREVVANRPTAGGWETFTLEPK